MTSVLDHDKRPTDSLRILSWGTTASFIVGIATCHALSVLESPPFETLVPGAFLVLPLTFGALVAALAERELPLAPRIGLAFAAAVVSLAGVFVGALAYVLGLAAA